MKKLILIIFVGLLFQPVYSQSNIVEFLKAGKEDANVLFNAYLDPYAVAFGDGLNNGWYNSAATHKLFGIDLTISVSAIQVPTGSTTFDLNSIGLTKLTLADPTNHIAPTIAGKDINGPALQLNDDNGNPIATFNSPNGIGLDVFPVPMAQIGFGLLPHTDVIGRFIPDRKYSYNGDQMKLGFWGVGVKHNFTEWFPFLKALPFDASLFGSYSNVNAQSLLNINPNDYATGNVRITFGDNLGQMLKLNTITTKFGLVVSKKLAFLTLFGGIGQSTSESTIDLIGKYVIVTTVNVGGVEITDKENLDNPIALKFETKNISLDAGLKIKLAFLSIFGSVNKAEYVSYNTGVSFTVR